MKYDELVLTIAGTPLPFGEYAKLGFVEVRFDPQREPKRMTLSSTTTTFCDTVVQHHIGEQDCQPVICKKDVIDIATTFYNTVVLCGSARAPVLHPGLKGVTWGGLKPKRKFKQI